MDELEKDLAIYTEQLKAVEEEIKGITTQDMQYLQILNSVHAKNIIKKLNEIKKILGV